MMRAKAMLRGAREREMKRVKGEAIGEGVGGGGEKEQREWRVEKKKKKEESRAEGLPEFTIYMSSPRGQ